MIARSGSGSPPSFDGRARHENLLVAALPRDERARLEAAGEEVDVPRGRVLVNAGEPATTIWFPITVMTSTIVDLPTGESVEVGLMGAEGFVGLNVVLGDPVSSTTVLAQIPGRALRLPTPALEQHLRQPGNRLRGVLLRYVSAFLGSVGLAAACNAGHRLEARLARWLLMTADRAGPKFQLTQEFLALMLGVRRATVTVAVETLRTAGAIRAERGNIEILDRQALHALACPCYDAMNGLMRDAMRAI